MTDYLLDTNHLSTMVTDDHPVQRRIQKQIRFGDTFAIAVPALTEMLYGILTLPRAEENIRSWQDDSVMFTYYSIGQDDAEDAAYLQADLRSRGRQLETVDALIAIIALRYNLTLLTTDNDFNDIEGLALENWFT